MDKLNKVPDPPTMLLLASKIRHQVLFKSAILMAMEITGKAW